MAGFETVGAVNPVGGSTLPKDGLGLATKPATCHFVSFSDSGIITVNANVKFRYLFALTRQNRSAGLGRTRLFHPWGREPEGGVVRPRRSVSHVVGQVTC